MGCDDSAWGQTQMNFAPHTVSRMFKKAIISPKITVGDLQKLVALLRCIIEQLSQKKSYQQSKTRTGVLGTNLLG